MDVVTALCHTNVYNVYVFFQSQIWFSWTFTFWSQLLIVCHDDMQRTDVITSSQSWGSRDLGRWARIMVHQFVEFKYLDSISTERLWTGMHTQCLTSLSWMRLVNKFNQLIRCSCVVFSRMVESSVWGVSQLHGEESYSERLRSISGRARLQKWVVIMIYTRYHNITVFTNY